MIIFAVACPYETVDPTMQFKFCPS